MWHLLGAVAACAAFLAVLQFRGEVFEPNRAEMRKLRYGDVAGRVRAAGALGAAADDGPVARALLAALHDPDGRVRAEAAHALTGFFRNPETPQAAAARAELLAALRDEDGEVRAWAAMALAGLPRPPESQVVPALIAAARGAGPDLTRASAVNHLGFFALADATARGTLIAALKDRSPAVRGMAVQGLSIAFGRGPTGRTPVALPEEVKRGLVAAAGDADPLVRARVAFDVGLRLGGGALGDPAPLLGLLGDRDAYVRSAAASSLRWTGPWARYSVPALIRALGDRDASVRVAAATALGSLGADAEPALPALREATEDKDGSVRSAAAKAVGEIESRARRFRTAILPGLIASLGDEEPGVRRRAAATLGDAGPKAAAAVSGLVRCLSDREAPVRRAAAEALGRIGPAAVAARPELKRLAGDEDADVRRYAEAAEAAIRGGGAGALP
jgi:HEAT repeat protein